MHGHLNVKFGYFSFYPYIAYSFWLKILGFSPD